MKCLAALKCRDTQKLEIHEATVIRYQPTHQVIQWAPEYGGEANLIELAWADKAYGYSCATARRGERGKEHAQRSPIRR